MLGVDQAKWIAAAKATGPIEQCGETPMSMRGGERRDLLRRGQTAAMGDVHLHHVAGAQCRQPGEIGERIETLAGRDRQGRSASSPP